MLLVVYSSEAPPPPLPKIFSKRKFVDKEPDQGYKILKGGSMQESHSGENGCKRDIALIVLYYLARALILGDSKILMMGIIFHYFSKAGSQKPS